MRTSDWIDKDRISAAYGFGRPTDFDRIYRALKSAVKAVIPGRQSKKNIAQAERAAIKAFCRSLVRSRF